MKQIDIIKIVAGYAVAKIGINTIILHVTKSMIYRFNKRQIEMCRVVDVMGDTLYYDFRKIQLAT